MLDLYTVLQLPHDAPLRDIKGAYRMWAKMTHPDTGGCAEKFAAVQLAFEVLSDPERRAAYDRDGTITDPRIDQVQTKALGIIEQMMAQALSQLGDDGIVYNDITQSMRDSLEESRGNILADIDRTKRDIEKLSKFAKRFSTKSGGRNFLAGMIEFKVAQLEKRLVDTGNALQWHERAAEILKDFSFQADPPPTPVSVFGGGLYHGLGHQPARQS